MPQHLFHLKISRLRRLSQFFWWLTSVLQEICKIAKPMSDAVADGRDAGMFHMGYTAYPISSQANTNYFLSSVVAVRNRCESASRMHL